MVTNKPTNKDINNDILITEIKLRPALYDRSVTEYNDVVFKRNMWEEVNEKLFSDIWDELDETQKDLKRCEVTKRWNNLRTCFSRELKIMRDPLQSKRRKYIYFDKLSFLLGNTEPYPGYQQDDPEIHFDTITSIERLEDESSSYTEKSAEKKNMKNEQKKKARAQLKMKAEKKKSVENYVQYSINQLKDELAYNRNEEVSQMNSSASCGTPKTLLTDADTNFALSLVPMLKNVPMQKKIDAHIEILSVLKKYTSKARFEYSLVKYEKDEHASEQDDDSEITTLFEEDN